MMETLSIIERIIAILVTLTVGGVFGHLISLKFRHRSEEAKTKREEHDADLAGINNASELIKLYKDALADVKKLNQESEAKYLNRIQDLENQLKDAVTKLNNLIDKDEEKDNIIQELTKSQLVFKMEVNRMNSLLNSKCTDCIFKDQCEKYKATLITSNLSELDKK